MKVLNLIKQIRGLSYISKINYNKTQMKQSFSQFSQKVSKSSIDSVSKKLTKLGFKPIKTQPFRIETEVKNEKWRTTPYIKNKQPFDNRQNLYLRVIDLMKMFIRFQHKDFLLYACTQSNLQHILNKIQNYRLHNPEFQLLFHLLTENNRKQISLYLKLRQQILTRCGHNETKYKPISIHNQNKNFKTDNVQIGNISIDYMYWGVLAEMTKSPIEEDMIWWISEGSRKVKAVDFVRICLWAHQHAQLDNPQSQ